MTWIHPLSAEVEETAEALPVLRAHGCTATVFVLPGSWSSRWSSC
ncbi:hypothetical protein [Streptomyces halstedii]